MAQVLERSSNNRERDIGLVRQQAEQVAESANQITLTANEVAEGAEAQLRVLEEAVGIANEMTASMRSHCSRVAVPRMVTLATIPPRAAHAAATSMTA